ncbi:hypothetical protein MAPG_11406 [Magnaporthiopsis poae ATCC 64411]|uniref:Uncharacterized protein n=1 Tax=Magnaporthiopsis poae (strain ATCC 64411 / 73-15) TaxID=644358 RepID=A0A0C4EF69_MAGP6|nr:hypothetical protein MAPG_11406 [Magnaporthiopsis poae ATCC 64411]
MATAAVADFPTDDRIEPGSASIPPRPYPPSLASTPADATKIAGDVVRGLNDAIGAKNYDALASLFAPDGYWRDHLCTSWDLRTLKGRDAIKSFLADSSIGLKEVKLVGDPAGLRAPQPFPIDGFGKVLCLQFFITAETALGSADGVVRLVEADGGEWHILTLFVTLQSLRGFEEPLRHRREKGAEHAGLRSGKNWKDRREESFECVDAEPTVVIIGAGQAGLAVAARLKMLNVKTLVVDKAARVGDSWRGRYLGHLTSCFIFMRLKIKCVPVFTPKDKMGDFLEAYASLLELDVWNSTRLTSSVWDDVTGCWTLTLQRTKRDGTAETRTLHPRHVIQATGHSGTMNMPSIKGMDAFAGDRLCHSSQFPGAKKNAGGGKKAVVVGCCNSGHDIAHDLCENGYDVTMVQRSSTAVVSSTSILNVGLAGLYDEDAPPTAHADVWLYSLPAELFKRLQVDMNARENASDAALLAGLRAAGFKVDIGPHGGGLFMKYFQRGGGYYIDVGCSQLIIDGKIKIKQGHEVAEVLPKGIRLADGSELEADEVVFATGYQNMRTEARTVFGDAVADRVGDVWGFDAEGEFRTIWRPSGHPGFWFMGGNLALCRYYSRLLALQIKALEEGLNKAAA